MVRVIHYLIYLLARLAEAIVSLLPLDAAFVLGQAAGELAYLLLSKRRGIGLTNLRLAFGAEMSEAELRAINRRHFQLLGANLLAGIKASTMSSDKIWQRVTANVPEERPQIAWIAAISHIGCWELFSHLGAQYPQYQFGAVYRRFYNPYLDAYLRRTRARSGTTLFDRRADLLKCVRFLRDGGVVGVLVDQRAGHAGVWTPLFNRLTSSSTLAATLAIRTGAPIVPLAIYTTGRARWDLVFSEPFYPQTDDAEALTAQINHLLEQQIRRSPADWLWAHDRWRPNRPGFLFTRDQRHVFIPPEFERATLVPFRILLVSPDIETALPAVRAIKNGRPDAWLAVLTRAQLADAWRDVPEIAHVIEAADSISALRSQIRSAGDFDAAIFFAA
ncbi:MAG: hypothetical protein ACJ8IQ_10905, partial [Chthoniobacterales bacterium]